MEGGTGFRLFFTHCYLGLDNAATSANTRYCILIAFALLDKVKTYSLRPKVSGYDGS